MSFIQYSASANAKKYSPSVAFGKICRYCAYQERSHKEVRNKLYGYGLHQADVEKILTQLITDGFLNEERFAKAFAGGKFRMQKWGRNKIINELELHGVTSRCIRNGLKEIDDADYLKTLRALLKKKFNATDEPNPFKRRDKVAKFAIGKGYEPELTWEILKQISRGQEL